MVCPKCSGTKIFYTKFKETIKNEKDGKGQIIGTLPQYRCLNCNCTWDIIISKR